MKQRFVFYALLLCCIVTFSKISFAQGDDYCCDFTSIGNPFSCTTHTTTGHIGDHGNCTWYCAYRRADVIGICRGNASAWFDQAKAGGLPIGQLAEVGAIAVFHYFTYINKVWTDVGHVAYVEKTYSGGSFDVSEMGWEAWDCIHETKGCSEKSFGGLIGFIYPLNRMSYGFPNHSSEGFACGNNTEVAQGNDSSSWQVHIAGDNPGIESPPFSCGLMAKDTVIEFSARVLGNDYTSGAYMFLKDEKGSWDNEFLVGYVGMSNDYAIYTADLSSTCSDLEIKKFSIEMTNGGNGSDEYWTFDWLKIYSKSTSWDFKNSQLGWTIVSGARFADLYPNDVGYWRMEATGKQPRLASPYLYNLSPDFKMLGLICSARMDKDSSGNFRVDSQDPIMNIYFDLGSGIGSARVIQKHIKRDGANKKILVDIPADIQGKIARVYIDIFDSADYQGKFIAMERIDFIKTDGSTEDEEICARYGVTFANGEKQDVGAAGCTECGGGEFIDPFEDLEDGESSDDTASSGSNNFIPIEPWTFSRSTTCAYADKDNPYLPLNERNTFSEGDAVYFWLELNNLYVPVDVKVDFYQPNGDLYYSHDFGETFDPKSEGYEYYGWWRFWVNIFNIGECDADNINLTFRKGGWTVKTYVNSELTDTNYFTVKYNSIANLYYKDLDNDGYSDGVTITKCARPNGYKLSAELVSALKDCNDNNSDVHPNAFEICNGLDDDCDGRIDFIGYYSDGWHTDGTSQAFADCREKFKDIVGCPFDNGGSAYVHLVGIVWAQDFKQDILKPHYGDDGQSCIILNGKQGKAYIVKEGFWGKYKEVWGFSNLGAPKNNEYKLNSSMARQDFEKGRMIWYNKRVIVFWNR